MNNKEYTDEKLVIFDMIGTLTTNPHLISQILHLMMPNISINLLRREYWDYRVSRIDRDTFWKNIGIPNFDTFEEKFLNNIYFKEGVLEMAERMKDEYKLSILSNIPKEWGAFLAEKYELHSLFDEIVFSGDYKMKKPKVGLYRVLIKKFPNINTNNMFFVDDDLEDLETGARLGMKTIWLKSDQVSDSYVPDYVIEDISEMEAIMNKNP